MESFVVDTEKQQQLADEKKASEASLLKKDKRSAKSNKGILTNAKPESRHASIDDKQSQSKKISFVTPSPLNKKYKKGSRKRIKSF